MTPITNPAEEFFKDGLWSWHAATPTWLKVPGDAAGNLKVTLADPADLEAGKTILRAAISAASSGDNTLIAAAGAGIKNKILGIILVTSGDVDVRLESGAGGAALTGVISLASDGNGFVLPATFPGYHWLETAANTLLNLELSAAVQVSGCIVYYQET